MSDRGKNTTPNTTQYWNGRYWQQPMAIPNIYVATTGSDTTNTGLTVGDPFATLEAAMRLAMFSTVETIINMGAGDFDATVLAKTDTPPNGVRIVGTEYNVLVDDLVVSAFAGGPRTVTFAPSPGWSTDQWIGKCLRWKSGAVNVLPEARTKTINQSGADFVQINYPQVNVAVAAVPVGNVFQIVEPVTRLTGLAPVAVEGMVLPGRVDLENLIILANTPFGEIHISGVWKWFGVEVQNTSGGTVTVVCECEYFGAGSLDEPIQGRAGWGLSYLGSTLRFVGGFAEISMVGGQVIADRGSRLVWHSGRIVSSSTAYPHGGLNAIRGGNISFYDSATTGRLKIKYDNPAGAEVVAEYGGIIEIFMPIEHQGSSDMYRARDAHIRVIRNITAAVGAKAAPNMWAQYGGQIRLDGIDGALLGDALAGNFATVTRAAALWASGNSVCVAATLPPDVSNIYRYP